MAYNTSRKGGYKEMKKIFLFMLIIAVSTFGMAIKGSAEVEPQYGGVLRILAPNGPQVLSYVPEMGPGDHAAVFPAGERK